MQSITLYFRQGSSDKVYQAAIEPKDGGHVVTFAYGRRGSALSAGTKTNAPVPYPEAQRIYDKLVTEKTAKGYTPGESGTPYLDTNKASEATGIHCQLLNPVEEHQVDALIDDAGWWLQEKHDGRRMLIRKQGDQVSGINRLGLSVALPETLVKDAAQSSIDFILDGEAVGDDLHVFDALLIDDEEISGLRYGERYLRLKNLLASFQHRSIQLTKTAFTIQDKRDMYHRLKDASAEGVVFKSTIAPYVAGRPASGGSQLKFKFCETASFVVAKVNARRSISLQLLDGDRWVNAGNVTIPSNHEIPAQGRVVECRYLYAFRESGCIYQPVYLGVRDDIDDAECGVSQLKYKASTVAA